MRRATTMMALAIFAGCGGTGLTGGDAPDMAMSADLAMSGPDMAIQATPCMPAGGALRAQYVWNDVIVPMQRSDYAFDLNGDGRVDDQLGNIEGALAGQNIGVQAQATQAVTSGQSLTLIDVHADDLVNDDCVASDLEAATAMASPDFSGAGHFTVDATAQVGHFAGPLVSGKFSSQPSPAVAATPVIVTLKLPLLGAVTTVDVVGAHVQYTRGPDGKISGGQLNGAIRKKDVDGKLVPNIAASLTAQVQANPGTSSSMQILSIFDNGGKSDPSCAAGTCKNLDGSCAVKGDQVISDCEVASSGLIQNVLAPDVQLFDANGDYHPNPNNTNKDSLSIGLAFSAVPATF
ncbi:MAG: hypothetical protein JWM53_2168 [bacterium]|nr:hypothetical protein [bacterium]